jgi:hypothetical protein
MGIGLISSQKAFLTGVAVTFFVLSWIILAIVTPIVVKSLPEDYFASPDYLAVEGPFSAGVTLPRRLLLLLKNVVAWFLIVIGPFLFQSVFAPFFGLLLADFKAKPRLIRRFASIGFVWRALNALRRRSGLPLFTPPRPATSD